MIYILRPKWNGSEKYAYDNYDNKRTGGDGNANNGQGDNQATNSSNSGTANTLTNEQKQEVQSHIHLNIAPGVANADEKVQAFWDAFWKANSEMTSDEFSYYTSSNFEVTLMNQQDYASYSKQNNGNGTELGWTNTSNTPCNGGIITMVFNAAIFDNGFFDPHINNVDKISYAGRLLDLPSVIQHEFGHGFAYYTLGDTYNSFTAPYVENWAIWYCDISYRAPAGLAAQAYEYVDYRAYSWPSSWFSSPPVRYGWQPFGYEKNSMKVLK